MNLIIKTISIFIVITTLNACNKAEVKENMAIFDQAFIPAYYYAYVGDLKSTRIAMIPLHHVWQDFKKKYTSPDGNCDQWNQSIQMVDAWLEETDAALSDEDIRRALFQLDHARYEMSDLRWRVEMDYYLDYVWDLEGSISDAVDVATDPMLNLLGWKEFFRLSTTVLESWQTLQQQTLDPAIFGFSSSDLFMLKEHQQLMDVTIVSFLEAVDSADMCEFEEAAKALEQAYLDMLVLFGDFEAVQTFYAHNNKH